MNNTIPPEIKKWIEDEAGILYRKLAYPGKVQKPGNLLAELQRNAYIAGATSLYQHLQENGRVAELEKTIHDLQDDFNELVIEKDKEVERLKELLKKQVQEKAYNENKMWEGTIVEIYSGIDSAWDDYAKQNNL